MAGSSTFHAPLPERDESPKYSGIQGSTCLEVKSHVQKIIDVEMLHRILYTTDLCINRNNYLEL